MWVRGWNSLLLRGIQRLRCKRWHWVSLNVIRYIFVRDATSYRSVKNTLSPRLQNNWYCCRWRILRLHARDLKKKRNSTKKFKAKIIFVSSGRFWWGIYPATMKQSFSFDRYQENGNNFMIFTKVMANVSPSSSIEIRTFPV